MSNKSGWRCGTLTLVALLPLLGCGEPNPLGRKAISGTVEFDGSLLATGLIEFSPKDPAGQSTGASIRNGHYQIEAHQGVPPGSYLVRITSPTDQEEPVPEEELRPPGPQESGPRQPPPATERIPAEYNTKSDKLVEVTEAGPNEFDFDIPARSRKRR